jgi:hypothetical protein
MRNSLLVFGGGFAERQMLLNKIQKRYPLLRRGRSSVRKDEYEQIPNADGWFTNSLYFNFWDDKLKFDNNWTNNVNDNFGSASGSRR